MKKGCDRCLESVPKQRTSLTSQPFIDACYSSGGKPFVEAVKQFGVSDRGEPIKVPGWYAEYLELIGDFRIKETYTSGCSQVGKTLGHSLLLCYCLIEGGLNTLWSYDQERSLNIQVPSNFRPVVRGWLKRKGIKPSRDETQNNTLYQVLGASSQFVYVSTTKADNNQGTAAAGGIAVGVSRDILFLEERSQYTPGSSDPLKRRLDAGRLPSRPIRELGTPGSGLGIESSIKQAQYDFYPHCQCSECGHIAALDPKGSLLKEVERVINGKTKRTYLSESGRPVEWFCRNSHQAVETAYFGCPRCSAELTREVRGNAWFQCRKTGVKLRSLLDSLPKDIPERSLTAGVTLSPLLRIERTNIAADIIREGLETRNTADWQQQRLGHESQSNQNAVTLEMLIDAIRAEHTQAQTSVTIAGIDQGRAEDWIQVVRFHLPDNWQEMPMAQVCDTTVREILLGTDIERKLIPSRLKEFGVQYGLIDNEPDIPDAAKLCSASCLEMVDQKSNSSFDVHQATTHSGGIEYPCWHIRQEDFLKQVLNGFLMSMYRLPPEWEKWIGNPQERSPLVHLTAPSYEPSTGKWNRGKNNIDDLYYALMFAEAGFYIWLKQKQQRSSWVENDVYYSF